MARKKHAEHAAHPPLVPIEEHRAADQDTAIVDAFLADTLPDADRRTHVVVPRETIAGIIDTITRAKGETGYSAAALFDQALHALAALTK